MDVLEILDKLRRNEGLTVVTALHDLTLAGRFADRLVLLDKGKVASDGSACEVLTEERLIPSYGAGIRVVTNGVGRQVIPTRRQSDRSSQPTDWSPPAATARLPSLVLVNTGEGKGKSTAAFGTALRAIARLESRGRPVPQVGEWKVGEEAIGRKLGIDWWALGDGFTWDSADIDESEAIAREAWLSAKDRIGSDEYDLLILDEITYPINWGWIDIDDVLTAISNRPEPAQPHPHRPRRPLPSSRWPTP